MAHYSYKDVCSGIPAHIEEKFTEEHGCEPDGNPNYDGDYWVLTGMWIDELQEEIENLKSQLSEIKREKNGN